MPELLKKLYFGQLSPEERRGLRMEEHQSLIDEDNRQCRDFMDKLSDSLTAEFLEILANQTAEESYESCECFIDGFRMGARLMLEILEEPAPLQPNPQ